MGRAFKGPKFKVNIIVDKKKFQPILNSKLKQQSAPPVKFTLNSKELRKRLEFALSLVCDFSTEVSIRFCDTEEMILTNAHYRNKPYATDVLSFPVSHGEGREEEGLSYLGDILVCLPVCAKQAKSARIHESIELERMIIHGIIHLKGFDHERNDSAFRVMTVLEKSLAREIVSEFGTPDWFQLRL